MASTRTTGLPVEAEPGLEPGAVDHVLTLSCPDTLGIVHAVAACLHASGCNILDSAQYGDPDTGRFFMRVHFGVGSGGPAPEGVRRDFLPVAERFGMDWRLHDGGAKPRMAILVSRSDHCLHDLLYRYRIGELSCEVTSVLSNHPDACRVAASYGVPFHHLPVGEGGVAEQEERLRDRLREQAVDLVVLARYMQILSDGLCDELEGRAINIHHSFLPSFKGARPYHQAHARGVKLIGATAHFVTPVLDEGPIIEQDATRVDHKFTPEEMVAAGRDVERQVLARAVKLFLERRVLLNGHKTVVFR